MTTEAKKWDAFSAAMACEGADGIDHDQETLVSAWQFLIDEGMCFGPGPRVLQGFFGRMAAALIEQGICTPPRQPEKARA